MRTLCGLDIHKNSIFIYFLDSQGKKSEEKDGVSIREIKNIVKMTVTDILGLIKEVKFLFLLR